MYNVQEWLSNLNQNQGPTDLYNSEDKAQVVATAFQMAYVCVATPSTHAIGCGLWGILMALHHLSNNNMILCSHWSQSNPTQFHDCKSGAVVSILMLKSPGTSSVVVHTII